MKRIININEKIKEYIEQYIPIGGGDHVFCYPDQIVEMIKNGTSIPDNAIVCDIEQLKTKIIAMSCRYSLARERGCSGQVEWSDRLIKVDDVLKIFKEHSEEAKYNAE